MGNGQWAIFNGQLLKARETCQVFSFVSIFKGIQEIATPHTHSQGGRKFRNLAGLNSIQLSVSIKKVFVHWWQKNRGATTRFIGYN